jgi:hypothetical protein
MCLHAQFWSLEANPRRAYMGHQLRCLTLAYNRRRKSTCTQSWPRMCTHPPSGSRVQHVYTCIHPLAYEFSMCTHPPSGSRAQHVCDTSTLWLTGAACVRIHPLAHERILCKQHGTLAPDMQCTFPNTRARTCVHALDSPSCRRVRKQNKNFVRCSSARSSSLGLIFLHQSTLHSRLEWW